MSKPLIVLTLPRTGSNLLLDSLGMHPQAKNGGEIYNPAEIRNDGDWNMAKVMFYEAHCHGWEDANYLHLFREDIEAQLRSWRKACETGEWVKGGEMGPKSVFDENVSRWQIGAAKRLFGKIAPSISYEYLVEHWDKVTGGIIEMMDWKPMKINKVLEQQS